MFKAAMTRLGWLAAALLVAASIPAAAAEHGEPAKPAVVEKPAVKTAEKPAVEKPAVEKPAVEKPTEKAAEKPGEKGNDRLADKLAKDAASAQKVKKQVKKANGETVTSVDEPESQPPPLKISALKNEIRRHAEGGERGPKTERESLAKLAAELNEAREALRQDTARMEALMASADPAASQGGEGGKKAPAPLDLVAKALRGMKPEQAGPVVAHMDRKLAADALRRMPPADAGKVMGVLKPELAAELAAEIALRGPHAERKR